MILQNGYANLYSNLMMYAFVSIPLIGSNFVVAFSALATEVSILLFL
jgi:hypothetical protein